MPSESPLKRVLTAVGFQYLGRKSCGQSRGYAQMLKPTEDIRNRLTFAYLGYDLEGMRASPGWLVGMYPRTADCPILSRNQFIARDERRAVAEVKSE